MARRSHSRRTGSGKPDIEILSRVDLRPYTFSGGRTTTNAGLVTGRGKIAFATSRDAAIWKSTSLTGTAGICGAYGKQGGRYLARLESQNRQSNRVRLQSRMERRSFTSWMRKGRMFSVLLRTEVRLEPSVVADGQRIAFQCRSQGRPTSISTCTISQLENMCN